MATVRPRTSYVLYRSVAGIFSLLPARLSLLVGSLGGIVLSRFSASTRAVVAENLTHVIGTNDSAILQPLVRKAFASYGRYWASLARVHKTIGHAEKLSWQVEGGEHLDRAYAEGHGVVVALPHLGRWDEGGAYFARQGLDLTTVVEPAVSFELSDWFLRRRAALGLRVLNLGRNTASELLHTLRSGGVVCLLADRDVVGDGLQIKFFGEMTRLPAGPAVLALRTGAALLPAATYESPGGGLRIVIEPPIPTDRRGQLRSDTLRVTEALGERLEGFIREAPEQWHVFQPNWPADDAKTANGLDPT